MGGARPLAGIHRSPLLRLAAAACLALPLGACTVYQVAPGVYAPVPPTAFDRAWGAAVGALQDQGVALLSEDRGTGVVRGRRGGIDITASVQRQADGSARVQFDTSGAVAEDPQLIQRVSQSYDRRMGR